MTIGSEFASWYKQYHRVVSPLECNLLYDQEMKTDVVDICRSHTLATPLRVNAQCSLIVVSAQSP